MIKITIDPSAWIIWGLFRLAQAMSIRQAVVSITIEGQDREKRLLAAYERGIRHFPASVLDGANFMEEDLREIHLDGIKARKTIFSCADMRGSSFRNSDLRDLEIQFADLRNVDFSGADLTGACFDSSDLRGASFKNACLKEAQFYSADLVDTDFEGVDLKEVIFLEKARQLKSEHKLF
jgi:uncharacterized protein YjbI with pentapeptide repeats